MNMFRQNIEYYILRLAQLFDTIITSRSNVIPNFSSTLLMIYSDKSYISEPLALP